MSEIQNLLPSPHPSPQWGEGWGEGVIRNWDLELVWNF